MPTSRDVSLRDVLQKHEGDLLEEWIAEQSFATSRVRERVGEGELRHQCAEFLALFRAALSDGDLDTRAPRWQSLRELLAGISRSRTEQGYSPSEVAQFVFSLKRPLFHRLRDTTSDPAALGNAIWDATRVLDDLGLWTTEIYLKSREEVIHRQQSEMMELSTPVVKLWDGILALPLIGTLDSSRTQVVMESLLERIVETGAEIAIVDITGVPTVDTLVAQHLIKTVTAARLMGAEAIISGIRPQIAQTIVHLGVDLSGITTKSSLADAFIVALKRRGIGIGDGPLAAESDGGRA